MKRNTLYCLLPMLCLLLLAGCSKDKLFSTNTVRLGGQLSGLQEVPGRATQANGEMFLTLNLDTRVLTYEIAYTGLTPIMGHFHRGATGVNGPFEITFTSLQSPIRGQVTLDPAQVEGFQTGQYYANLHTTRFPAGEIRGQVQFINRY
jgi:hypothetical protein